MNGLLRARVARIGASPTRHSTYVLRATYPRAVSSLGREGVLIGRDALTGNAFAFCPFLSYSATGADHLSNPNMVVAGDIGMGKSSLVQSYLARQKVFGRKSHVFSVKRKEQQQGEYDNYAALVGGNIVRVVPGGRVMVNPLDAVWTGDAEEDGLIRPIRIGLMEGLVETLHGRPLQSDESNALGLSLDEVVAVNDQPTLPQVYAAFKDPTDAMCASLKLSQDEWTTRLHDTRQALYALCEGKFAGLFNGHTSADMRMDADHVVYDLEPLTRAGRAALPMFMAVATGRLHNTLAKETDRNIIVVYEEGWRVLAHLGVIRFMQESWKLARAHGVQNIIVLHRPSDFRTAGNEGTLEVELALGLLADTATKVVYKPQAQALEATGSMLALTPDEIAALPDLQVGEALWRIDSRSTIVRHQRSELETQLFSSDAGMQRQGVAV